MKIRTRTPRRLERLAFWTLIAAAIAMIVINAGCQAERTYHYSVTQHPDGTVEKTIEAKIKNSDVSVGELTAEGADGTKLTINDLSAQERVTAMIQATAEAVTATANALKTPLPTATATTDTP